MRRASGVAPLRCGAGLDSTRSTFAERVVLKAEPEETKRYGTLRLAGREADARDPLSVLRRFEVFSRLDVPRKVNAEFEANDFDAGGMKDDPESLYEMRSDGRMSWMRHASRRGERAREFVAFARTRERCAS